MPLRTSEGKVVLRELSTGQVIERWSVDARGIVASGSHEYVEGVDTRKTPIIPNLEAERKTRERQAAQVAQVPPPVVAVASERPAGLPDGYQMDGKGGYYTLTAPNGSVVEGPSKGKWQGAPAAIAAAQEHAAAGKPVAPGE